MMGLSLFGWLRLDLASLKNPSGNSFLAESARRSDQNSWLPPAEYREAGMLPQDFYVKDVAKKLQMHFLMKDV